MRVKLVFIFIMETFQPNEEDVSYQTLLVNTCLNPFYKNIFFKNIRLL